MQVNNVELNRSAFGTTGLSAITFMNVGAQTTPSEPVDRLERSAPTETPAPSQPPAPQPDPAATEVRVSYNPQDSLVMPGGETRVPRADIGADLSNPRMKMADSTPTVKPDAEGNYLFAPGTKGFQQANTFVSAERPLRMMEQGVGHEIPWAFSGKLDIHPHAGGGFNAYYSRQGKSINFFDGNDPIRKKTIAASESLEVVSHEAGHAILDGMKPGMLGWFASAEAEAFHESFGDMIAILTTLQDDRVVDRVVEQTGGDLKKQNIVAALGEDLSLGINNSVFDGAKPAGWTIRNAINSFTYADPKTLPSSPKDDNQLGREAHNFSRLFTGAFYDILNGLTAKEMAAGKTPGDAIKAARDVLTPLLARTVELGPNRMKKYQEMADAMVAADKKDFNGAHLDVITSVFANRKIRPATAPKPELPDVRLEGPLSSNDDAAKFLATHRPALGVAADAPLRPAARWTNERGEQFVRYDYTQDASVGQNLSTQVAGSLTVAFDRDGKLFHSLYEPIDKQQLDLVKDIVDFHFAEGDILEGGSLTKAVKDDGHPWLGYVAVSAEGDRQLVRIPATT